MAYQLTAKGAELTRRMTLENPCATDTSEHFLWIEGAMMAVCGDPPPNDRATPAAHEGYAWGQQFNREWQESGYPVGSKE